MSPRTVKCRFCMIGGSQLGARAEGGRWKLLIKGSGMLSTLTTAKRIPGVDKQKVGRGGVTVSKGLGQGCQSCRSLAGRLGRRKERHGTGL